MQNNTLTATVVLSVTAVLLMAGVVWCVTCAPDKVPTIPLILTALAAVIAAIHGTRQPGTSHSGKGKGKRKPPKKTK